MRVGILYGGRSGEHDVSLCSAASVVSALDKKYDVIAIGIDRSGVWHVQDKPIIVDDPDFGKKLQLNEDSDWLVKHHECGGKLCLIDITTKKEITLDVVFPVLHGTFCEDGTLQGLLELAMVPYVGADVLGSSVGMDKDVAKRLLRDAGIPVVPWIKIEKNEWLVKCDTIKNNCSADLGYPCFVKPANAGSSVGVIKVSDESEVKEAVDSSLQYDMKVLVERAINAREIECAVLGNNDPVASVLGEVIPKHEFYSYEAKYLDADGASLIIPGELDASLSDGIRTTAVKAYKVLNCSGMARVDFFVEKNSSDFYLNEINTLPGFTSISMYPKLWDYSGLPYKELLDRLIELALERYKEKSNIKRDL